MKNLFLTTLLLSGSMSVFADGGFTLKGNVPGLPAGTRISLVSEGGRRSVIAETEAAGDSFILTGNVGSPMLCELRFDDPDPQTMDKGISFMVEDTGMSFSATAYKDMPNGFFVGTGGLDMMKNVEVKGGKAQEEYQEYLDTMEPYVRASKEAHYNLFWDEGRDKSEAGQKKLQEIFAAASLAESSARRDFIKAHPSYSISGQMLVQDLSEPYSFTGEELDEFLRLTEGMWDKSRLEKVREAIEKSRKYPRLAAYTDFAVLDTELKECKFSDLRNDGKYTLVDFWASWCGPCRQAIPHVRELYKKYTGKLDVLSVSLDSAEKPWRTAMDKEKMEWTQLWADSGRVDAIKNPYQIKGIPYLLLVDPSGSIIFTGSSPDELEDVLRKKLGF